MKTLFIGTAMTAALVLSACQGANETLSQDARIQTPLGPVQGVTTENPDIYNFKGLPFAAPPIGDLRWRAPTPPAPWAETRTADTFSPMCMQTTDESSSLLTRLVQGHGLGAFKSFLINRVVSAEASPQVSEDCLYLNVRTGNLKSETPAPVMVWIHGGGHQFGSGDFEYYQSNALVERGVVLVTINYRLGAFGYLAHPALSADDPNGVSGNYGTQDQIAALKWVRDNISAFGGDPDNVTIFGESAGSWSVTELMASPLAQGLFHKAIGQSGSATYHLGQLDENKLGWVSGYETAAKLDAELNLENPTAQTLRALPATDILAALTPEISDGFHHNRDGYVFPKSVGLAFQSGDYYSVPTLFGYNTDEGTLFFPTDPEPSVWIEGFPREGLAAQIASLIPHYGDVSETLIDLYGLDNPDTFTAGATQMMGDEIFGVNVRYVARRNFELGQTSYLYTFGRIPPSTNQTLGAFHAAEIPFVFDTHLSILGVSDTDEALTEQIGAYWTNFAKTGNPNSDTLPQWPTYQGQNWMQFGGNNDVSSGVVTNFRHAKLNALEHGLQQKLDALATGDEPIRTPPNSDASD